MNNVWVGTDWHLWSVNSVTDKRHQFRSISNLGRLSDAYAEDIQSDDIFIYLGDLCDPSVTDIKKLKTIVSSIPGYKVLCKGNHDTQDDTFYKEIGFDVVCEICVIHNLVFSHKPVRVPMGYLNIHGHLHTEKMSTLGYQHINAYDSNFFERPMLVDDLIDSAAFQSPEEYAGTDLKHVEEKFEKYTSVENDTYTQIVDLTDMVGLYPVDEAVELPTFKTPEELFKWMKSNIHYANFTKLKSSDGVVESKSGSCHDQVVFEYNALKNMGKKPKILFFIAYREGSNQGGMTHSLVYYSEGNKVKWFENSWSGMEGIHTYNSLSDLKANIRKMYSNMPDAKNFPELEFKSASISDFDTGMNLGEFVSGIMDETANDPLDEVLFSDITDVQYWENDDDAPKKKKVKQSPLDTDNQGVVAESANSQLLKLFFISSEEDLHETEMTPRIPNNYMTDNGYEDNKTPRISFSTSIDGCLMGLGKNVSNQVFYVYQPAGKYKVITPTIDQVPDVKITKERWICEPVKLVRVGKIRAIDENGPHDDGIPYTYGKNGEHEARLYHWGWKWIKQFKYNLNESATMNTFPFIFLSQENMNDELYPEGKMLLRNMDDAVQELYLYQRPAGEYYVHNTEPGYYRIIMSPEFSAGYFSTDTINLSAVGKIKVNADYSWEWIEQYGSDMNEAKGLGSRVYQLININQPMTEAFFPGAGISLHYAENNIQKTAIQEIKSLIKSNKFKGLNPKPYSIEKSTIIIELVDGSQDERESHKNELVVIAKELKDVLTVKYSNEVKTVTNGDGDEGCIYIKLKKNVDMTINETASNKFSRVKAIIDNIPKEEHHWFYHGDEFKDSPYVKYRDVMYLKNGRGKTIGGFIDVYSFDSDPDTGIVVIALEPGARGTGLATKLVQKALKKLPSLGIKKVIWRADVDNIASQKLAKKLGFTDISDLKANPDQYKYEYVLNEMHLNSLSAAVEDTTELHEMSPKDKQAIANKYGLRTPGEYQQDGQDKTQERVNQRREKQLKDLKKARKIKKRKAFVRKVKSHLPGAQNESAMGILSMPKVVSSPPFDIDDKVDLYVGLANKKINEYGKTAKNIPVPKRKFKKNPNKNRTVPDYYLKLWFNPDRASNLLINDASPNQHTIWLYPDEYCTLMFVCADGVCRVYMLDSYIAGDYHQFLGSFQVDMGIGARLKAALKEDSSGVDDSESDHYEADATDRDPLWGDRNHFFKHPNAADPDIDTSITENYKVKLINPTMFMDSINEDSGGDNSTFNKIKAFNMSLTYNFRYGLRINGIYDPDRNTTADDWDRYYQYQRPHDFNKSKVGTCWDYVGYESWYFSRNFQNVQYNTYCIIFRDGITDPSHTFLIFQLNGNYYYFESSFKKNAGIYVGQNENELIEHVISMMVEHYPSPGVNPEEVIRSGKCKVYQYNANDPRFYKIKGAEQYLSFIEKNGEEVSIQYKPNKKSDVVLVHSGTLYHGSLNKHSILKPKSKIDGKNLLFASPRYEFALAYAGRQWNDLDINQSVVNDQLILVEIYPGAFENIFQTSGYIYEVPDDTFQRVSSSEYISEVDVVPTKTRRVQNVLVELEKSNVQLYYYPNLPPYMPSRYEYVKARCDQYGIDFKKIQNDLYRKGATDIIAPIQENYKFELVDKNLRFVDRLDEAATKNQKLYPVYVVLVHSGTGVSKAIKAISHSEYSHASICFDSSLDKMYSFARKDPRNPFIGGFRYESIGKGFYEQKEIPYAVYVVPCTESQVKKMKKRLNYFIQNQEKFTFDFTGLVTNYLGIVNNPAHRWFCSRFVADVLNAGAPKNNPYVAEPSLQDPDDFKDTDWAIYVDSGENLMKYDRKKVDRKTNQILRKEMLRRMAVNESAIFDLDAFNPFIESTLNYQFAMMDEAAVDDFVRYLKSFKVKFDKEGNVIISRREVDQLDKHFRQSLRMIKAYENAGDLDSVKLELCKINYMIELINEYYLSPKAMKNKRVKADLRKEMLDLRSVMLNAFSQHLKYVKTMDPAFNFKSYYDTSIYGKNIEIPKPVLSAIGKAIVTQL